MEMKMSRNVVSVIAAMSIALAGEDTFASPQPICHCDVPGPAGCPESPACEACVCDQDPFCCNNSWDSICADRATGACESSCCPLPPSPCGPGAGHCCSANNTPGCDNAACCEAVCACDPFCCDVVWDHFCAFPGFSDDMCPCGFGMCNATGHPECGCPNGPPPACSPTAGDCFTANLTPGCDEPDCCAAVCADDLFCCNVAWDSICAAAAMSYTECTGCPPTAVSCPDCKIATGDCCTPHPDFGCGDFECCEVICASDPFCCDTSWDDLCADAAIAQCEVCQPVGGEGCSLGFWKQPHHFEHWQGYSPDDLFPDVFWVAGPPSSNCCENQCVAGTGNPTGCDDPDCEALICGSDPFCCDVCWDAICANAANANCLVCTVGDALQTDAFMGMTLLEVLTQPSGPPEPEYPPQLNNLGKHAVAALLNASSGMSYALSENDAKTMFIEAHFAWKADRGGVLTSAKNIFAEYNTAGCALSHPADLNMDETVNVFDLLIMLSNWGGDGIGDVNEDGVVNVFDMLELLSAWGPV